MVISGIAILNAEIRAKLQERGLNMLDPSAQESFRFFDPDGFQLQVSAPDFVGLVSRRNWCLDTYHSGNQVFNSYRPSTGNSGSAECVV